MQVCVFCQNQTGKIKKKHVGNAIDNTGNIEYVINKSVSFETKTR